MPETRIFNVPDLGEGLTDATLTGWSVVEGDVVSLNQVVCSLVTAKAEVDIPSPWAGRVGRLHGLAGDTIDVGSPLFAVDVDPTDAPTSTMSAPGSTALAAGGTPPTGALAPDGEGVGTPVLVGYGTAAPPPRRLRTWRSEPDSASVSTASPSTSTSASAVPEMQTPPGLTIDPPARVLAKPPVRALAKRLGVDLAALAPGSGPDGILTRQDVETAGRDRNGHADGITNQPNGAQTRVSSPAPSPDGPPASNGATQGVRVVPVQGVRALIAERMTTSRQTIPEAWCGLWVDATELVTLVERLRTVTDGPVAPVLTPFAVMLRYVVSALARHPALNATFDAAAGEIRMYDAVHLGVAVADDRGLIVPVVRHAERLTTGGLALETRRLISAVRSGTATPAELGGSTFTVSNFGALGLDDGNPIINVPEAAILGVGAIKSRPAVVDDAIVVRRTAKLTCAFDHRVCDGADAGGFLRDLARMIEHPDLALLDL